MVDTSQMRMSSRHHHLQSQVVDGGCSVLTLQTASTDGLFESSKVVIPHQNNDVINMQYIELEEFLLDNAVAAVSQQQQQQQQEQQQQVPKVFIDTEPPTQHQHLVAAISPEKQYHVSLEPRPGGLLMPQQQQQQQQQQQLCTSGNSSISSFDSHALQVNNVSRNVEILNALPDPNSPPQSVCDSPPGDSSSPPNSSASSSTLPPIRTIGPTRNSTAHKSSSVRRVSTSSCSSIPLVVTPPSTPQQPSPPLAAVISPQSQPQSQPQPPLPTPPTQQPTLELRQIKPRKAVKRSRKESVPDDSKDEKYWKRRAKNNEAAKRSRDLRREKENHIMQRVAFLERENAILNQELSSIKMENDELRKRLSRYESV